jgi:hypothetical protein
MRYVGYVACMEKGFGKVFVPDTLKEKHHLEDPGIEGWITLKNIFKKHDEGQGLDRDMRQSIANMMKSGFD